MTDSDVIIKIGVFVLISICTAVKLTDPLTVLFKIV